MKDNSVERARQSASINPYSALYYDMALSMPLQGIIYGYPSLKEAQEAAIARWPYGPFYIKEVKPADWVIMLYGGRCDDHE